MRVLIIGHRGASAYYPENTLLAIRKAIEMGADIIEVDIRLSRDRYPVVIHDETLDRTTNGKGPVSMYTLSELKSFNAGLGEKIPSLEEVLRYFQNIDKVLFLELKEIGATDKSLELVRKYDLLNRTYFISFHIKALQRLNKLDQKVNLGLLYSSPDKWINLAVKLKCKAILPKYTITTKKVVKQAHREGLEVFTWTIDDPKRAVKYARIGVDGIATNKPDILIKALADEGFR